MNDYIILSADSQSTLRIQVKEYMKNGYEFVGGIGVGTIEQSLLGSVRTIYCQAMAKVK